MSTSSTERSAAPLMRSAPAGAAGTAASRSGARERPPVTAPPRPSQLSRARYEYPVLAAIVALTAVLCTWGIDRSVFHVFYASAVRSMTDNPVAFLYGSFDPMNSITLDKLPGFLWPQAVSALVFGFHPWALVLPQGIEAVGCVLLLHVLVRRWAGVPAGLLAAAFMALTPVTVGVGRSIVEDAPFLLLLLLAAEATQRAVGRAKLRTLLLAGVWVGAAFQCKMLEAWAVLPALAVTYLVAAPASLRRRVGHIALAGAVTLAMSASWAAVATLTPLRDRPYLDGTTNNSPFGLIVGYNFLGRFNGLGATAVGMGGVATGQSGPHAAATAGRLSDSALKMFSPGLATQTGWLYPLAAVGLVWGLAVARRRRVPRTDPALAGHLMWGTWLAAFFAAFSVGSVTGHTYYMGVVAVALCALSGPALVRCWHALRVGGPRAWVFPAVIAANVMWCTALTLYYGRFMPWLAPAAGTLCALALVLLAWSGLRGTGRARVAAAGLAAGLASILLVPAAWSASALSPRYNQPGSMGRVGPLSRPGSGGPVRLKPAQWRLLGYLEAHRDRAAYLVAVPAWTDASAYILSANAPILPMGGFTGQVPFPTLRQFERLIGSGELRYVILGHRDLVRSHHATSTTGSVVRWVESHCAPVRLTPGATPAGQRLYRCGGGPPALRDKRP